MFLLNYQTIWFKRTSFFGMEEKENLKPWMVPYFTKLQALHQDYMSPMWGWN